MKETKSTIKIITVVCLPFLLFGVVLSFYCGCCAILHSTLFCSSRPKVCLSNTEEQTSTYAKAKANCLLYKTPSTNSDLSNEYFIVPEGYFVRILEETSDSVYKVIYSDRVGYVLRTCVRRVSIEPQVAHPEPIALSTKSGSGTILREFATSSSSSVALVPENSEIMYIASILGDKPADGLSYEWYFVQFFPQTEPNIYYEGYVYSERVAAAPIVATNTEDDPIIPLPLKPSSEEDVEIKNSPVWLRAILISVLVLPCILFALYLIAAIVRHKRNADNIATM